MQTPQKYHPRIQGILQWKSLSFLFLLFILILFGCIDYKPTVPELDYTKIPESKFEYYTNVDSTLQRFSTIKKTNDRLDSLFFCIELLINYDEEAALDYAKEANRLATEKGKKEGRALSYYYMALLKGRQQIRGENLEGAIVDAEIAQQLFENTDRNYYKVEATRLLGYLHYKKYDLKIAENYLLQSFELVKEYSFSEVEANKSKGEISHTLASVYAKKDSTYNKAVEYFEKSLELYKKTDNQRAMARLREDLGKLYTRKNNFIVADSLFRLSLEYALNNKDNFLIGTVYHMLGRLKYGQFKKTKELNFFNEALDYYQKGLINTENNLYLFYNRIANTYHLKAATSHYQPLDIDSAIIYYSKALQQAQLEGVFEVMPKMVRNISNLCNDRIQEIGEDCKVLLGKSYTTLLNESYSAINTEVINDLELANKKSNDFERKTLEAENSRRVQNQRLLGIGALLFASLTFFIILQFFRQKRLKAKMEALRAQINPHFISNSLNAIESLVNLDQKDAASKYIIHFSRLSRQILNGSREANTTLAEEIKMLEHFLALEQLRFRDKLNYRIDVEEDIKPELLVLPSLILQPYVENAIWHGIKPKEGPGLLQIKVRKTDKELHCSIEDDGIGRAKAAELKAASVLKQKSIGMQINHERLQAAGKMKGSRLNIEDLFDAQGNPAGTRVFLRLPLKYKKQ